MENVCNAVTALSLLADLACRLLPQVPRYVRLQWFAICAVLHSWPRVMG